MKTTFIALLAICCLLSLASHGIKYYVSPTGNDANSGKSTTSPWKTIARVNAQSFYGDTILFLGGSTFSGSLYFTNTDIGTSTKPVVIGSYGTGRAIINSGVSMGLLIYNAAGFVVKDLIFTGAGRLTNMRNGILIYLDIPKKQLSYLSLNNLEVYGYRDAGIMIGSWDTVSAVTDTLTASRFSNITISNCNVHDNGRSGIETYTKGNTVHKNVVVRYSKTYNNSGIATQTYGNSGSGILLANVDGARVEYCTSYNNGWLHNTPDGGPFGIWAHASMNVTFQFNESHHNKTGSNKDGGGFDFDGGCVNSTMQYNYSHDNYGAGYLLAQYNGAKTMKTITIRYNISENDGRKGDQGSIHLWASGTSGGIQTVRIYNNTIFTQPSTTSTPKGFYIRSGPMSGIKLWNNIFQATGGVPLVQVPYNTSSCLFQGNSYWPSGSTFKIIWGTTTYFSLSTWRTGTGNKQEYLNGVAKGLQVDAQFASETLGVTFNDPTKLTTLQRYKLKSTSGLINKGLNIASLFGVNVGTRDYWGNSLSGKTTFHIGAFQGTPISTTANIIASTDEARTDMAFGAPQEFQFKENILQVLSGPARQDMIINFALAKPGRTKIALYNLQGQLVKNIFSGEVNAGYSRQIIVNTDKLTTGIYFVSMYVNGEVATKKVLFNK
jgi:hypothetical protein